MPSAAGPLGPDLVFLSLFPVTFLVHCNRRLLECRRGAVRFSLLRVVSALGISPPLRSVSQSVSVAISSSPSSSFLLCSPLLLLREASFSVQLLLPFDRLFLSFPLPPNQPQLTPLSLSQSPPPPPDPAPSLTLGGTGTTRSIISSAAVALCPSDELTTDGRSGCFYMRRHGGTRALHSWMATCFVFLQFSSDEN